MSCKVDALCHDSQATCQQPNSALVKVYRPTHRNPPFLYMCNHKGYEPGSKLSKTDQITHPAKYQGFTYWIEKPQDQEHYHYIIEYKGKPIKSEEPFDSTVSAGQQARNAIRNYVSSQSNYFEK